MHLQVIIGIEESEAILLTHMRSFSIYSRHPIFDRLFMFDGETDCI